MAIQEPETEWWKSHGLSNPENLIKLLASRSNCLRVVDRGAQALIALVDACTTEQVYMAEGAAQKRDIGFTVGAGGDGLGGLIGAVGGGYSDTDTDTDTDIGKIISAAYFNAHLDLVNHIQGGAVPTGAEAKANAGPAAQVTTAAVQLRAAPAPAARIVYAMKVGALVYPNGARKGVWMGVDDENGNHGGMSSAFASPR